jgi:hypothetical protein
MADGWCDRLRIRPCPAGPKAIPDGAIRPYGGEVLGWKALRMASHDLPQVTDRPVPGADRVPA